MDDHRPPEPPPEPPLFRHPTWMIGIVVVLGVVAALAGLSDPVWWLIGAPCILASALYLWVRLVAR